MINQIPMIILSQEKNIKSISKVQTMFKSYLKISFRHLWQNKLYSAINVMGLAAGITCMLLAVLYVKDEQSFDTFHTHNPDLFRITTNIIPNKGDKLQNIGGTGQVQGPAFKNEVPEVQQFVRVMGGDIFGDVVGADKTLHLQQLFVDENFFDIFSFELLHGSAKTVLKDINNVVITESTALKFFNSLNVIGKQLQLDADPSAKRLGKPMIITGVVKDQPKNSSIRFDMLLPLKFIQLSFDDTNWLNAYLGTFVVLRPGADIRVVAQKFNQVFAAYAKEQVAENKKSFGYDRQISYGLQRITDIHLQPLYNSRGSREGGVINGSNPVFSYLFLGIAIFILLMAGINFINISIANSLKRAKEVGVRKITGSSQIQIILQFLVESALLCLAAFALAVLITNLSLPLFNQLTGKQILRAEALDKQLVFYGAIIIMMIVLLTGLYPAYILSNFKPSQALYNKQKLTGRNVFGKSLVVVQFSLAVFFVIATITYYNQMDYVRTKDLGYNPYQIIRSNIPGNRETKPIQEFLRNELAKEPSIEQISFGGDRSFTVDAAIGDNHIQVMNKVIDENYLPVMEIQLKAGRNFSTAFQTDKTNGVIVNEAFVKVAGLKAALGTNIILTDGPEKETKTIIGVVKDYHFGSLKERIQPMVMTMSDWLGNNILVKFEKSKQNEAMIAWAEAYKRAMPQAIFQSGFLDEINEKEYLQEERWQKVTSIAAVLSILICCLGLFGLSHLATHQRTKEIGIRKVLGASVFHLASLLSKDFLKLVFIANAIAFPIAWWAANRWLQEYAYHIEVKGWVFGVAGTSAVVIALLTVSFQAIKAAVANPVKSLRTE
ncbi:MAG: ABC transporter permease [Ginsengibacter sp.]